METESPRKGLEEVEEDTDTSPWKEVESFRNAQWAVSAILSLFEILEREREDNGMWGILIDVWGFFLEQAVKWTRNYGLSFNKSPEKEWG